MATPFAVDVSLDGGWAVGAIFGGHLAEVLAEAAIAATGSALAPVSTSVAFLRPAMPGPARVTATVIRSGRRYSVVSCTLETDAGPAATALVTLAPGQSLPFTTGAEPADLPPEPTERIGAVAERVDWRTITPWPGSSSRGSFEAWFRSRDDRFDAARYLVASDLIGPAIAAAGRPLPFRIATVALEVSALAVSDSSWLRQVVDVTLLGGEAVARLELRDPNGTLLALATHRVVILDATDDELPLSVTAFGWGY